MATYVLVHGAWHGGWCWARVATLLRTAGHQVFTPTLSGCAERAHLASVPVTLSTHIQDIAGLLHWEDLRDVILVGHSYAGAVISGVAAQAAARLRALVYLDAFLPEPGEALWQLMLPEAQQNLLRRMRATTLAPPPAAHFAVNQADRAQVDRLCTPHPLGCFLEPLPASGAGQVAQRHYIFATAYPNTPFRPQQARAEAAGFQMATIATGHDAMLDNPRELGRLLLTQVACPASHAL